MADLLINNKDAQSNWGIHMGKDFLDTLLAPLEVKEYVTNEVRDEDGTRIMMPNGAPFFKQRSLVLSFVCIGTSEADFKAKKEAFLRVIYGGQITLKIPPVSNDVYRLIYNGQGCTWKMNAKRTIATITLKFVEPNPRNRA